MKKANLYLVLFVLLLSTSISCAKKGVDLDLSKKTPTIVEISGGWDCTDCSMMASIVTEASKKFQNRIKFIRGLKLNSPEMKNFEKEMASIPNPEPPIYLLFNKDREHVISFMGAGPKNEVFAQFELLANGNMAKAKEAPKPPKLDFDHKKLPVFVFYYADWCGYCRKTMPTIDKLEKHFKGKVFFKRVNVDTEKSFTSKYRPKRGGVPYFQFYKQNGEYIADGIGAVPEEYFFAYFLQHFDLK